MDNQAAVEINAAPGSSAVAKTNSNRASSNIGVLD